MTQRAFFAFFALALSTSGAAAGEAVSSTAPATSAPTAPPAAEATARSGMKHPEPPCADIKPDCALTVSPAIDRKGRLFVAFTVGKSVYVAASSDGGRSFAPPATIATIGDGTIDSHGDARPKVVALNDGGLIASYTTRPDKQMIGTIFTARSTDGGKTFSPPQAMLSEGGQRFEAFTVSPKGRIYAGWLDKTHALKAKAEGREFAGSGVAFATSDDGGATFKGKSILMDHACECCKMSAAIDRDGQAVFAWRQVFEDGARDHYAARLSADGATLSGGRVSDDNWVINACPHQGPSLAIDRAGVWHLAWFTKGKTRQGLFYAQSRDNGKSFSTPEKIGDDARAPSFAALLATKDRLYRVWKEFDGTTTTVPMQMSRDGGKNWSAPRVMASAADAADSPQLVDDGRRAFLSWAAHREGYRLIPLPRDEKSADAR
jgi:hypothetical protein